MPYQTNPGLQYDKQHAITLVAADNVAAARFIGYDGNYATRDGGVHDAQGVSEAPAPLGYALPCITGYSALVEASGPIALGDWVTVASDGSGRATVGSSANHCGRALGQASAAGQLIEVQVLAHVHA